MTAKIDIDVLKIFKNQEQMRLKNQQKNKNSQSQLKIYLF